MSRSKRPDVTATPPARPAAGRPEVTASEVGPSEPLPTVQTSAIFRSTPLTPRAALTGAIVPVLLTDATPGAAGWTSPRPLTSRPVAPSPMTTVVNVPGLPSAPSLWRQLAEGGKTLDSKTAQAGQSTGDAFKRFGLTLGRAFTGDP